MENENQEKEGKLEGNIPKVEAKVESADEGTISPEQSKKIERQSITLLVILMLVLASFVVAYFLLKPKPYFEYQDMKVYPIRYENSNLIFYSIPLTFSIGGQAFEKNVVLRNDPRMIENLSYNVSQNLFKMAGIGLTMEPTLSSQALIAAQEIGKLGKTINLPTFFGVTREVEGAQDIFDCENASTILRIVRLELGNETKIEEKGNCIVITGEDYDNLMKASDKLTVEWLKVLLGRGIENPIENEPQLNESEIIKELNISNSLNTTSNQS